MPRPHRHIRLELVAGCKECANLVRGEEMGHIPSDFAGASARQYEGVCNAERLQVLAEFTDW